MALLTALCAVHLKSGPDELDELLVELLVELNELLLKLNGVLLKLDELLLELIEPLLKLNELLLAIEAGLGEVLGPLALLRLCARLVAVPGAPQRDKTGWATDDALVFDSVVALLGATVLAMGATGGVGRLLPLLEAPWLFRFSPDPVDVLDGPDNLAFPLLFIFFSPC